ncbi:FTR1 family protein [Staphylococcus massiliensis]|uniref:FTR1 family iron permease n=1 Tax=Staphylococcus massiliensis TaxID=555791 RepID=UPI001EDCA24A|nr:FTR1 family protein [Staphylococcus massiliensis]
MKRYGIRTISLILCLMFLSLNLFEVQSASNYQEIYIKITEARVVIDDSTTRSKVDDAFNDIKAAINKDPDLKALKKLQETLKALNVDSSTTEQNETLTNITKILLELEQTSAKSESDNHDVKIGQLQSNLEMHKKAFTQSLDINDEEGLKKANSELNRIWTKYERYIRDKNIEKYGQIEIKLFEMRRLVEGGKPETKNVLALYDDIISDVRDVELSRPSQSKNNTYTTQTLLEELDGAIKHIEKHQVTKAKSNLNQFMRIWPYVEGDIRTKDQGLYTQIEADIPRFAVVLNSDNHESVKKDLSTLYKDIQKVVHHSEYSYIDVSLVLLREGVEVIIIVMSLSSITRTLNSRKGTVLLYSGSVIGLLLSLIGAYVLISAFQNSGILRESLEAFIGLIAVILMFIVGIWLHRHASRKQWEILINNLNQQALDHNKLWLFGVIGCMSVLREGVETIVFYLGMIGHISSKQLVLGIILGLLVLVGFSIAYRFLIKWIPIRYVFRVLSILMLVLAFKMIGVSIYQLQILNFIPKHVIESLPTISTLGLFPTVEVVSVQLIFILITLAYVFVHQRKLDS